MKPADPSSPAAQQAAPPVQPMHAHRSPPKRGKPDNPATRALMANMVAACMLRAHPKASLAALLGVSQPTLTGWLEKAHANGLLVYSKQAEARGYMTPSLWARTFPGLPLPDGTVIALPSANTPARTTWTPGTCTVSIAGNVRITRQAAPRGRFEPDARVAGRGVISSDYVARRFGQQMPSRLPALTGGTALPLARPPQHLDPRQPSESTTA